MRCCGVSLAPRCSFAGIGQASVVSSNFITLAGDFHNSKGATMAKELAGLRSVWDQHAKSGPLLAILSVPEKEGRKWDLEEFSSDRRARYCARNEGHRRARDCAKPRRRNRLGCGVGRLTQPLASRFDLAIGIDISPTMIDAAVKLNRFGNKAQYILNTLDNHSAIPDHIAGLVFSHITLQHMTPPQGRALHL
jgi:SAM-dependent methyltransferase